jgi:predicted MFS family arabinose efflux permease
MGLFTGIFWSIFQFSQIVGNLIAGVILVQKQANSTQTLAFIFMGTAGFGVFSFLFMRPQPIPHTEKPHQLSLTENLFRAILLLKEKKMIFLVPLYFFSGLEQGFIFGSFTKDIAGKCLGTDKIGFVMSVFGAADSLSSFGLGKLADKYNTNHVATIGFIAHLIFFSLFFGLIEISGFGFLEQKEYIIYLGAILAGIGDAAWNTYPTAVTSKLFTNNVEAAFAVFKFSQSLGTFFTFAIGAYLTIQVKLAGFFWVYGHCVDLDDLYDSFCYREE